MIDAYLTELRYSLVKLAPTDVDDIVDEVEDHLLTALSVAIANGIEQDRAEAEVLATFGSAGLVARVFAEEAKRGAAVSTSVTRRAGVAAMASVAFLAVGQTGSHLTSRGFVHGIFLAILSAGFPMLAYGMWGLRRRHGGLGTIGRVAFWWFVASPVLAAPAMYGAPIVLAIEWLLIMTMLGIGMIRARVLPAPAVALFTMSPLAAIAIALGLSLASRDAGPWFLSLLAPVAAGFVWLGWAMSREPALDTRDVVHSFPPFTTA